MMVHLQVTYGTGAVEGAIIQDDVTIAGLALPAHTFGVTTNETDDFGSNNVPLVLTHLFSSLILSLLVRDVSLD